MCFIGTAPGFVASIAASLFFFFVGFVLICSSCTFNQRADFWLMPAAAIPGSKCVFIVPSTWVLTFQLWNKRDNWVRVRICICQWPPHCPLLKIALLTSCELARNCAYRTTATKQPIGFQSGFEDDSSTYSHTQSAPFSILSFQLPPWGIKAHSPLPFLFVRFGTLADVSALPILFVPLFTLADIQRCIIGWLLKNSIWKSSSSSKTKKKK